MYVIDTDKEKCKFCLGILNQDEIVQNFSICNECRSVITLTPDLSNKMELNIQKVKKFIEKYAPNEVTLETAKTFLDNDYVNEQEKQFVKGTIDDRYNDMARSGIKISGKMVMVSFIPRVVEIVKYTTFRKVTKITKATYHDKAFLRNYWQERYFLDLPNNWDYVVHISFIKRKKKKYEEAIYSFPSCVIDKFYTLITEKPIHEIFSQVFTQDEFFSKYNSFLYFIDLKHLKKLSNHVNLANPLINPAIITIIDESTQRENRFYNPDDENSQQFYNPKNFFYYSPEDHVFLSISYYEYEYLMLTHVIGFINKYYNLPEAIDIITGKKTKFGMYVTIKFDSFFICKPFVKNKNNYDIGNTEAFINNAREQPKLNINYIPMIDPGEEVQAQYVYTPKIKCNRCTKKIDEDQILIGVKKYGLIEKQYHIGCVDLSYVKNRINTEGLRQEDCQFIINEI